MPSNLRSSERPNAATAIGPDLHGHSTVTPALQAAARLARTSPFGVALDLPASRAAAAIERLAQRYPSSQASHLDRSAMRRLSLPAVQFLVMPPRRARPGGPLRVGVLLFANVAPDDAESWAEVTATAQPLTWGLYEMTTPAQIAQGHQRVGRQTGKQRTGEAERITWRLSRTAREEYRETITRLVHSTKPAKSGSRSGPRPGTTRSPAGQRAALERLGQHLARLPGLSGIRADHYELQRHMLRLWRQQHPSEPAPEWPALRWSGLLPAKLLPLADLLAQEAPADVPRDLESTGTAGKAT